MSCFSHDLKDLLDKVFEMDPVSSGACMVILVQTCREMDSINSIGRGGGCERSGRKGTRLVQGRGGGRKAQKEMDSISARSGEEL